jgi:hypothetical protein
MEMLQWMAELASTGIDEAGVYRLPASVSRQALHQQQDKGRGQAKPEEDFGKMQGSGVGKHLYEVH